MGMTTRTSNRALQALLVASCFGTTASAATPCGGEWPCTFGISDTGIQLSKGVLKFQARISQAKMPIPEGELLAVEVNLVDTTQKKRCGQKFNNVKVLNSILNLDFEPTDCDLDQVVAAIPDLQFQLVIGGNPVKSIPIGTVPYALKANHAVKAQEAHQSDVAAQAHYAHRITADRQTLQSNTIGKGYFDFFTPPTEGGDLYPGALYSPYANDGFMQWTPVSGPPVLHLAAKGVGDDRLAMLEAIYLEAKNTTARGTVVVEPGVAEAGIDGGVQYGFTVRSRGIDVNGGAIVRGGSTLSEGLTVRGSATIAGGTTITEGAQITGGASIANGAFIDGGATIIGGVGIEGGLTVGSSGSLVCNGNATFGPPASNTSTVDFNSTAVFNSPVTFHKKVTLDLPISGTVEEGSITTSKLHDLAVTTSKLDNGAVTTEKLGVSVVQSKNLDVLQGGLGVPSLRANVSGRDAYTPTRYYPRPPNLVFSNAITVEGSKYDVVGVSARVDPLPLFAPSAQIGVAGCVGDQVGCDLTVFTNSFEMNGQMFLRSFTAGVLGVNPEGEGVHGESTKGAGVVGYSSSNFGVRGRSKSADGVYGSSETGFGVYGYSLSGPGGSFGSDTGAALHLEPVNGLPATASLGDIVILTDGSFHVYAGNPAAWRTVYLY